MKICLLTNDYPPIEGGISAYVKGLSQGFNTLGHHCDMLFFPVNVNISVEEKNVISHPVKGRWTFSRILSSKKAIGRYKDKIRISDIVIISSWSPLGIAYKAIFPRQKPTSILLSHGNDILDPIRSAKYKNLMKKTLEHFDVLTANSHYTAGLCNRVTDKKVIVIGGGLDQRFYQTINHHDKPRDPKFTILSVGRLIERKGFDLVIKSLASIRHSLLDWRYIIIGNDVYEKELRRLISEFGLQEHVMILTNVGNKELLDWYAASDLFIMVSREIPEEGEVEGLGLVYMEAGAARLPVIAGRSGGVSDVVKDGFNGILVDPHSVEEVSQAILKTYQDNELRKYLGSNGRQLAENEWRWEKVAQKILSAADKS